MLSFKKCKKRAERARTIINQHLFCLPAQSQISWKSSSSSSYSCSTIGKLSSVLRLQKRFEESYLGLNNSFGSFSSLSANYWTINTYFSYVKVFFSLHDISFSLQLFLPPNFECSSQSASLHTSLSLLCLIFRLFVGTFDLCAWFLYDYYVLFFFMIIFRDYISRQILRDIRETERWWSCCRFASSEVLLVSLMFHLSTSAAIFYYRNFSC